MSSEFSNDARTILSIDTTMFSDLAGSYSSTTQLALTFAGIFLVFGIYRIFTFIYNELTSPLRDIPGPSNPSFIYGNFKQLSESVSRKAQDCIGVIAEVDIFHREISRCRRSGSSNMDQQSNSKCCSG